MTRFHKGTLDHDGDGHMGGSGKGDSTMAKAPAKAKTAKADTIKKDAALAAKTLATAALQFRGRIDVNRAATEAQFAAADEKGAPNAEELEEIRIGQEIRGF